MDLDTELIRLLDRSIIGEKAYNLIAAGAKPDVLNTCGYSLLHILTFNRFFEQIYTLVQKFKANINIQDSRGRSPLFYMLEDCYPLDHIVQMIKKGADPRTTNREGVAALTLLLKYDFDFVLELISAQPNLLFFKDKNGTLLENMLNLRGEVHFTAAEYIGLVRYGADGDVKDNRGTSLLAVINHIGNTYEVKEFSILNQMPHKERIHYSCKLMGYFIFEDFAELIGDLQNNTISNLEITYLAKYPLGKELLIQYIKTLDTDLQLKLIQLSLTPGTPLNTFFSVQRGWFMTDISRGTLGQLKQMQMDIEKNQAEINARFGI